MPPASGPARMSDFNGDIDQWYTAHTSARRGGSSEVPQRLSQQALSKTPVASRSPQRPHTPTPRGGRADGQDIPSPFPQRPNTPTPRGGLEGGQTVVAGAKRRAESPAEDDLDDSAAPLFREDLEKPWVKYRDVVQLQECFRDLKGMLNDSLASERKAAEEARSAAITLGAFETKLQSKQSAFEDTASCLTESAAKAAESIEAAYAELAQRLSGQK